jgi:hypothetical protein
MNKKFSGLNLNTQRTLLEINSLATTANIRLSFEIEDADSCQDRLCDLQNQIIQVQQKLQVLINDRD